jgi:hypothetical protein
VPDQSLACADLLEDQEPPSRITASMIAHLLIDECLSPEFVGLAQQLGTSSLPAFASAA